MDYGNRPYLDWVALLRTSAEMVFPMDRATGAAPDPFDGMILECSLASGADAIVSGDKKHLLVLREFRGIPILKPAEFLRLLG